MKTDVYTKVVLTVIAVALADIAVVRTPMPTAAAAPTATGPENPGAALLPKDDVEIFHAGNAYDFLMVDRRSGQVAAYELRHDDKANQWAYTRLVGGNVVRHVGDEVERPK